jgi:hypothetical protein
MEPIFSGWSDFLADSQPVEGDVPAAYTAVLEQLCDILAASGSQAIPSDVLGVKVIQGLLALGAIARAAAANSLPAQLVGWTFSLEPAPLKAMTLTLHRPGASPSVLYAQLDRDFRLHGMFTLGMGGAANEQLLSFDLEKTDLGWSLRRWKDDGKVSFPMQVPVGAPVPWAPGGGADLWDQYLPASSAPAVGALLQALHSFTSAPQPPVPEPAPDQTVQIIQPKAAFTDLVLVNQQDGQKIPLKGRLTIGRGEDSDLRLDDREMSRSHAPVGWQIQDLNSSNGTWLNDNRLVETALLHAGDRLRFGNTRFRVESLK